MKTKVINVDGFGIVGIERLIWHNPDWKLTTCGQTLIHHLNRSINFAVFEKANVLGADFVEPDFSK